MKHPQNPSGRVKENRRILDDERRPSIINMPGGGAYEPAQLIGRLPAFDSKFLTDNFPLTYDAGYKASVEAIKQGGNVADTLRQGAKSLRSEAETARLDVQRLRDQQADVGDCARRLAEGIRMEKPSGSSLHHLAEFLRHTIGEQSKMASDIAGGLFQSFVVEHDWAGAFAGSDEFDKGEIRMPFDWTCFEFRINGMRVLLPFGISTDSHEPMGMMITGINGRWYVNETHMQFVGGQLCVTADLTRRTGMKVSDRLLYMLGQQIRAVCIMLEAEVAVRVVVEPSEKLSKARERVGKSPLRSYHVVSLAQRWRTRNNLEGLDTPGTKKRCHFRRGHYRHFHKTGKDRIWINWQMVGSPDLGFVDKHYKL